MDNNRLYSILAYIGPLFLVGLIAAPQEPKVKFHVNQGLVLFICEIVVGIILAIIGAVFGLIHLGILTTILTLIFWLAVVLMVVLGVVNAANDKQTPLPVIGEFTLIK